MYSTSIHNGGLGFPPRTIGIALACRGLASALFQLTLSARVLRRYGARKTLMFAFTTMLVTIGAFPLMNFLAKANGEKMHPVVWAILGLQLSMSTFQSLCYCSLFPFSFIVTCVSCSSAPASIHVLLVDSATTKSTLASVNSIAQTMACALRALAPSVASSVFSLSLEKNLLGGDLVYVTWIFVVASAVHTASKIPARLQNI